MKEIRVGLIGTGVIAHQHMDRYSQLADVTVVAACDLIPEKRNKFCEQYKIENQYDNFRDMLKRDDLDVIDICLHNNLHTPVAVEAMRAGFNCYCEKPMAGSYADAVLMQKVAEETGKLLHIQLAFLYIDQTHAAKKLINDGYLGNIYHARSYGFRRRGRPFVDGYAEKEFNSSYWASGGALYDMGVYHISQLLYVLDLPEIERVSGQVYQELDMHEGRRKESGFDVEELGVGFVKLKNNITMDIIESWAIHASDFPPSMIAGSKGGVAFSHDSKLEYSSEICGYPAVTQLDLGNEVYRTHQANPSLYNYDDSQTHMVATLRGECKFLNTPQIAIQTMLLSEGIYLSGKHGRELTADEIKQMSVSKAIKRQETPFGVLEYNL